MNSQTKKYCIAGALAFGIYVMYRLYKKNEETKAVEDAKNKALTAANTPATSLVAVTDGSTVPAGAQTFISNQSNPDSVVTGL